LPARALVLFAGSAAIVAADCGADAILAVRWWPRPILYIGLATQMAIVRLRSRW